MSWRLLEFDDRNLYEVAALPFMIAEEIEKGRSPKTVIFTTERGISMGKIASLSSINMEECRKQSLPIVRYEISGDWGPCLSDENGLYFFSIYDTTDEKYSSDVREATRIIVDSVISVCKSFGLSAERSGHRPDSNDVVIDNRKICGITITRSGNCIIGNFSFIVGFDFDLAEKVLKIPESKFDDKPYNNIRGWLTTLRGELGREILIKEVRSAFIKSFEDQYGMKLVGGTLTEIEEIKVRDRAEVYRTDDWLKYGKWSPVKDYWRPE